MVVADIDNNRRSFDCIEDNNYCCSSDDTTLHRSVARHFVVEFVVEMMVAVVVVSGLLFWGSTGPPPLLQLFWLWAMVLALREFYLRVFFPNGSPTTAAAYYSIGCGVRAELRHASDQLVDVLSLLWC